MCYIINELDAFIVPVIVMTFWEISKFFEHGKTR